MRTICILIVLLASLAMPGAVADHKKIDVDIDAKADLTVAARAKASAEGKLRYAWDWGDGQVSAGASARHAYRDPGVYRVTVTVTDEAGHAWTRAREVEVKAREPALELRVDERRVRASVDVDSRARVEWDWGDGDESRGRRASHRYDEPGAYEVTLKVEERDGRCWSETRTVVVEAEPRKDAEDEAEETEERDRGRARRVEARAEARVGVPAVDARVALDWGREHVRERSSSERGGDAHVRVASSDRRDAPGVGAPMMLAGVGAMALARKFMKN